MAFVCFQMSTGTSKPKPKYNKSQLATGIKYKQSREQIRAWGKSIESSVLQGAKHNKRRLSKVVSW